MNACSGQADRSRDEDEKALCSLLPISPPPPMQAKCMENFQALGLDEPLGSHSSTPHPAWIDHCVDKKPTWQACPVEKWGAVEVWWGLGLLYPLVGFNLAIQELS